jgi:hypothetical protein
MKETLAMRKKINMSTWMKCAQEKNISSVLFQRNRRKKSRKKRNDTTSVVGFFLLTYLRVYDASVVFLFY